MYLFTHKKKLHFIKSGISAWARANGRNRLGWKRKYELDIFYTQNVSLLFDIKILLMTIKKVFLGSDFIEYRDEPTK
ncbi:sugar transferase [Alkalibacterium sp. 20]|uniref:sugar transferase n=1 Tax=Alkalibacterium sp. 20 TaxID=1798803 RepID=UPI00352738E1